MFRIEENEKFGKFVGSVLADDQDIDKTTNGKVTYSIVEGGSPFSIKPLTGIWLFHSQIEAFASGILNAC